MEILDFINRWKKLLLVLGAILLASYFMGKCSNLLSDKNTVPDQQQEVTTQPTDESAPYVLVIEVPEIDLPAVEAAFGMSFGQMPEEINLQTFPKEKGFFARRPCSFPETRGTTLMHKIKALDAGFSQINYRANIGEKFLDVCGLFLNDRLALIYVDDREIDSYYFSEDLRKHFNEKYGNANSTDFGDLSFWFWQSETLKIEMSYPITKNPLATKDQIIEEQMFQQDYSYLLYVDSRLVPYIDEAFDLEMQRLKELSEEERLEQEKERQEELDEF